MVDFTEALNRPVEAVEKPKPKPTGTYLAIVQGMPKQVTRTIKDEEVPIISFSCKAMSAQEDVDQDQLNDVGEISTWPPFSRDFFINSDEGIYALKRFLTETLELDGAGKTMSQLIAEAPGKQLLITLKHRPYTNKNTNEMEIATEIGSTAKA